MVAWDLAPPSEAREAGEGEGEEQGFTGSPLAREYPTDAPSSPPCTAGAEGVGVRLGK